MEIWSQELCCWSQISKRMVKKYSTLIGKKSHRKIKIRDASGALEYESLYMKNLDYKIPLDPST